MNFSIKTKNGLKITVNDFNISSVHDSIISFKYDKHVIEEIYNMFEFPKCIWGKRPAIKIKNLIDENERLKPYFISLWITSEPFNKANFGSELIFSFFADLTLNTTIFDLITMYIDEIEKHFPYYAIDFNI